ncbi:MAG: GntR family transcriptional regulator, partial [Verrucomicrobiota bacterium]
MPLTRDPDPPVRAPVHHPLNDRLPALIRGGGYPPGARFPTEREVAAHYGVRRLTANKTLAGLASAGHLEFRPGVGTFVRAPARENDLRSWVSFTHHARLAGRPPETRVPRFQRLTAAGLAPGLRQALAIEAATPLLFVERLRLAGGQPVILERRHLVAERCRGLDRPALAGSLDEWFAREGIPVGRSDR